MSRITAWKAVSVTVCAAIMGWGLCNGLATSTAQSSGGLQADSLNTSQLNYEKQLLAMYLGDFDSVGWQPESGAFAKLFPMYVTSFGRRCAAYLPSNKVEIMTRECSLESTPVDVYGNPAGPSSCIEYRTVGTGIYAKPDLYAIKVRLETLVGNAMIGDMLFNMPADPFATTVTLSDAILMANDDAQQVVAANSCDSRALLRLEDNMARFAQGDRSLKLASGDTLADVQARAPQTKSLQSADLQRLVDDLIADNARGWMLNQYARGSVSGVNVEQRDAQGHPVSLRANYQFSQLGQMAAGWVQLQFQQGRPSCLYFYDAPSTCRVASPRVANAYERGDY
ncbi:MAG: hypothetical protein AAFY82_01570 [Pseudomonadota bacterium]